MKINFELPSDGLMHRYCFSCLKEGAKQVKIDGITQYHCDACGQDNGRAIYFDKHKVWLDDQRELWHESAGVFVRRADGKFLFFQRTEYPLYLTVPSGHVDRGEDPSVAAARELVEETGIIGSPVLIGTSDIVGDSCSAGADAHKWHVFLLKLDGPNRQVEILEEGEKALWLTLAEAKGQGMVFVVEKAADLFGKQLES